MSFPSFSLPSNRQKDVEIVLNQLENSQTDYIFCFGQKPVIKNKICIESLAKKDNQILEANLNIKSLFKLFCDEGIVATESTKPGTSYCNNVYWHTLDAIKSTHQNCQCVFIHVPFEKNIDDMAVFSKKIEKVIGDFILL